MDDLPHLPPFLIQKVIKEFPCAELFRLWRQSLPLDPMRAVYLAAWRKKGCMAASPSAPRKPSVRPRSPSASPKGSPSAKKAKPSAAKGVASPRRSLAF